MKKLFTMIILVLLVLVVASRPQEAFAQETVGFSVTSQHTHVIAKKTYYEIEKNRPTFLYYENIGTVQSPKYKVIVASALDLEIGTSIEVYTIRLNYGFSYNVIHLGNKKLDTSYHTYLLEV